MTGFVQNVISGLSLGSLYALTALGIALVFGVMRLVNFAYGEIIMLAGYAMAALGAVPLIALAGVAILTGGIVALSMERIAFRPVRSAAPTTLLATSFAISFLLQHLGLTIWSSLPKAIIYPQSLIEAFSIGSLRIAKLDVLTVAAALLCFAGLALLLKRTAIGVQLRAAADDFTMARFVGVRSNAVVAAAFTVSGVLAGIVALLYLAQLGTVTPTIGLTPMLIGVVATIVGGMDRLSGAIAGGYVVGLATILLQAYLPPDLAPFRDAFVYGFVICVLLARPQGLLTRNAHMPRV